MWTMAWTQLVWIALVCSFLVSGVYSNRQRKILSARAQVEDQIALESFSNQDQIQLPAYDQLTDEQIPKASYRYGYQVSNSEEGNEYSHDQKTEQGVTKGEYRILLPDNRWQIVSYEADENGYRATVRYESADPAGSASTPIEESYWGFSPSQGHRVVSHSTHPVNSPSIQHPFNAASSPQNAYRRPQVPSIEKSKGAPPVPEIITQQPSIALKAPQQLPGSVFEESSIKPSRENTISSTERPRISQGQVLRQPASVLTQPKDQLGHSIHDVYQNREPSDHIRSKGAPAFSLQYFQTDSKEVPYSHLPVEPFLFSPQNVELGPTVPNHVPEPPQGPIYGQRFRQPKPVSNPQGQRVNYQTELPLLNLPIHTTVRPVIPEPYEPKSEPPPIVEKKPIELHPTEKSPLAPISVVNPFSDSIEKKLTPQPAEPSLILPFSDPTKQKAIPPYSKPVLDAPYSVRSPNPGWLYTSSPPYGINGQVQSHVTHPYPKLPSVTEDPHIVDWVPVVQVVHQSDSGQINQRPPHHQVPEEDDGELEPHQVVVNPQYQPANQPVGLPTPHPFLPRPPVYVDSAQLLYGLLSKETSDGNSKFLQHEAKPIEPKPAYHIHHAPQNVQQQSGYSKINYQPAKPITEALKFYNPYGSHRIHIVSPASRPAYSRPATYNYPPDSTSVKPPQVFHSNVYKPTSPQIFSFTSEDTKPFTHDNVGFNPVPPVTPEVVKPITFPPVHKFEHFQKISEDDFQPISPNFEPEKHPKKTEPSSGLKPVPTLKGSKSSSRPKYSSKVQESTSTHQFSNDYHSKPHSSFITTYKPQTDVFSSSYQNPYDSSTALYKPQDPITTYKPEQPETNFVPVTHPANLQDSSAYKPSPELNNHYPPKIYDIVTTYRPVPSVTHSNSKPESAYYPVSDTPPPQKVDVPDILTPIAVTEPVLPPLSPEEIELLEGEAPTEPSIPEETPPPVKPVIESPPPARHPVYGGHKLEKKPFDFTPIGPFPSPATRPQKKQPKGVSGVDRPLISPNQHPFRPQHSVFGDFGERIQPLKRLNEPAQPEPTKHFDLEGEAAIEQEPVNEFRPILSTPTPANEEVDTFIVFRKPEDELEGSPPIEEDTQFFDDTAIRFDPAPVIRNRGNPIPEMIELAADILDKNFVASQAEANTESVFFIQTTTPSALEAEAQTEPFARWSDETLRTSTERDTAFRFTTIRPTEEPLESEAKTEPPVSVKPTKKVVRKPIGRLRVGVQRRQRNESTTTSTMRPIKRARFLVVRNESTNLSPQFNASRIRFPPRIRFVQNSERFVRNSPPNVDLSDLVDHSTLKDGVGLDRLVQSASQQIPSTEEKVPDHTTKQNDETHTVKNSNLDTNLRDLTEDQIEQVSERSSKKLVPVEVRPFEYLFKRRNTGESVELKPDA